MLSRTIIRAGQRPDTVEAARGWSPWHRQDHVARPNRFDVGPRLAARSEHGHLLLQHSHLLPTSARPPLPTARPNPSERWRVSDAAPAVVPWLVVNNTLGSMSVTCRDTARSRARRVKRVSPPGRRSQSRRPAPALTSWFSSVDLSVIDRRVSAAARTDEMPVAACSGLNGRPFRSERHLNTPLSWPVQVRVEACVFPYRRPVIPTGRV